MARRHGLVGLVGLALALGVCSVPTVAKAAAARSVAGRSVAASDFVDDPDGSPKLPVPVWPQPSSTVVDLSAASPSVAAPSAARPVSLSTPNAGTKAAGGSVSPQTARLKVLDQATVGSLGGLGVGFRVSRADGVAVSGPVQVTVSYDGFRSAAPSLASRIRLVRLPACAMASPNNPACFIGETVPAANDGASGALSATISADPDPAAGVPLVPFGVPDDEAAALSGGSVFLVQTAASSAAGDYRATDLRATGS